MSDNNLYQLNTKLSNQPLIVILRFHAHNSYGGNFYWFKESYIYKNLENIYGDTKVLNAFNRLVEYENNLKESNGL